MKTEIKITELMPVNSENLNSANESIRTFVAKRKLVIEGSLPVLVPVVFPSHKAEKKYRRMMAGVIHHTTMRNANVFLNFHNKLTGEEKSKIDYSPKEKAIKKSKADWKESLKKMLEMKQAYRTEKGDFYKS